MDYASAIKWIYSTQLFGIKLGLDTMRRLLAALDLPGKTQRFVHVAGTNGKGSTCAIVDSIARAGGWRGGLYTSPHLISFCERIRVDGATIPESEAAARLSHLRELIECWEPHPTFFEITTALALWWFRDAEAQIVALETGLGGRLDATNAVTPVVSVITPIAFDHMQWLGNTLSKIAFEKAGVIKSSVPVVVAPQEADAMAVIRRVAGERGAPMTVIEAPWPRGPLGLAGTHQRWNAALAVRALKAAGIRVTETVIERGLATVSWPARFQQIGTRIVIDGSHNPHGARALAGTWREVFASEKATIILGAVTQKNYRGIVDALRPIAAEWIFTTVNSPRAVSARQLAATVPGARIAENCAQALALAGIDLSTAADPGRRGPQRVLVCGSLYLAGEALAALGNKAGLFEPSAQ
ncbi:MAG: bifunctional folylpolyglutamate synthase/dihydrofolate synthase [Verrucomicrobiales bacterium]